MVASRAWKRPFRTTRELGHRRSLWTGRARGSGPRQSGRMPRKNPLPARLSGTAFLTGDSDFHGLGRSRLRREDVAHPFHGVRSIDLDLESIVDLCRAYEPLLRKGLCFSHVTAARLFGIPLPDTIALEPLHVSSFGQGSPPRRRGVRGHLLSETDVTLVLGLPVTSAAETWCQLAVVLCREDLVAAGDYLVSGTRLPGGGRSAPLCTRDELVATGERHVRQRGARSIAWALQRIRSGVDSRTESRLRLLLVSAGIPEPVIGMPVLVDFGRLTLHPDLALPRWGVVFDYEGDLHRTDRTTFLSDIRRRELLEAESLRVIRVSSDDVFVTPDDFIARVFRVLALRETQPR